MACYMAFPTGMFYIFNRPELFFEKDVIAIRQQLYPPEDPVQREAFKRVVKEVQHRQQEREFEMQQKLYEKKLAAQAGSMPLEE